MYGKVIKGIGGFYFIRQDGKVIMGRARGILKRKNSIIYVGDFVDYEIQDSGDLIINRVFERRNSLVRPPISNIDMLVVVFAVESPRVNFLTVDKLCVGCEIRNIPVAICINKIDLAEDSEIEELKAVYEGVYPVVTVGGISGKGLDELLALIKGKTVALAGPSGVGKSTILNSIVPEAAAETGNISEKTDRGKHTTRHVEIFDIDKNTSIFDTPGFTSIDVPELSRHDLASYFPEFEKYSKACKYSDCMHLKEPKCMVKNAVEAGKISTERYESYLEMIKEIDDKKKY